MTSQEVQYRYAALSGEKKPLFLMDVAHELSVCARHYYTKGDPEAQQALMGINELQHHLSAETRHLIQKDAERYPDDVLMKILIEKAAHYGIANYLATAIGKGFGWREV